MKARYILLCFAGYFGATGWAAYKSHQDRNRAAPRYAGRICDEVWSQTRATMPTVAWYHACITEAAKAIEAQRSKARAAVPKGFAQGGSA